MAEVIDQTPAEDTRRKLIEAAGELFAEHGFHQASVREISERAGVTGAAVDYHFRDKSELYGAVLGECHCTATEEEGEWRCDSEDPEDQLQHFIDRFIRRLLNPGRPRWHRALMSREMLDPTGALDQMVEQAIRPDARELEAIIHQLTGGDLPRDRVMMLSFSVVAQCLFYLHDRAIIERIYPKFRASPPSMEQIVEHVFAFSITAIREFGSPA